MDRSSSNHRLRSSDVRFGFSCNIWTIASDRAPGLDKSRLVIYFPIVVNRMGSLRNGSVSERPQQVRSLNSWNSLREVNYRETLYRDGRWRIPTKPWSGRPENPFSADWVKSNIIPIVNWHFGILTVTSPKLQLIAVQVPSEAISPRFSFDTTDLTAPQQDSISCTSPVQQGRGRMPRGPRVFARSATPTGSLPPLIRCSLYLAASAMRPTTQTDER